MELADVTLEEALQRLDAIDDRLTKRVLHGKVSFWLGTGISLTRAPGLKDLLTQLLTELQARIADPGDPNDPAFEALCSIIDITTVCKKYIDFSKTPDKWENKEGLPVEKEILNQLQNNYEHVFDVRYAPSGNRVDLVWDILRVHEKYGDPDLKPDAEHRILALLIEEGVVQSLLTTNWDPLLEKAHEQTSELYTHALHVVVRPEEIHDHRAGLPILIKIHGCAKRASEDETTYRPSIIATHYQIQQWGQEEQYRPLRVAMGDMAQKYTVFYLGLSGQDYNIQVQHLEHMLPRLNGMNHYPPQVLFSGKPMDLNKRAVLKCVYGGEYYDKHASQIDSEAIVPLYAKPLLGALYVRTILEKLRASVITAPQEFQLTYQTTCIQGLNAVEALLKRRYGATVTDPDRRWRMLSDELARFVASALDIYRDGTWKDYRWAYHPISPNHLGSPHASQQRMYGLVLIVTVLTLGHERGYWKLIPTPYDPEQCRIHTPTGNEIPMFIVDDITVSDHLYYNTIRLDRESIILHMNSSESPYPPGTRSSQQRALPGASLSPTIHNIFLQDCIRNQEDLLNYLRDKFDELSLI